MASTAPRSVCPVGATLGEGPVWFDGALWFVDIKQQRVHRFDPVAEKLNSWPAPAQVGWVLPAASGGMIAGLQGGLYRFDPAGGTLTLLVPVETDRPGNRLNDASTDPAGRIWFGSMDDAEANPTGQFHRFESGKVTPAGLPEVCITNGPAVSPDGRLLYHVDTLGRRILVSDIHADGSLGPQRVFAEIERGYPDGPTVDSEGCVWIGLYGGWQARRYSPAGALIETVRFPVANITKLAFGGDDLRTVYATTARKGLSAEELEQQPEAGNLFAFHSDVAGVSVTFAAI